MIEEVDSLPTSYLNTKMDENQESEVSGCAMYFSKYRSYVLMRRMRIRLENKYTAYIHIWPYKRMSVSSYVGPTLVTTARCAVFGPTAAMTVPQYPKPPPERAVIMIPDGSETPNKV